MTPGVTDCQGTVEVYKQILYSVGMDEQRKGHLRIGELSQRTGVSPELLRAWERRYELLRPDRSSGGFRLYSAADEARVHRMQGYLRRGIAAAEAARLADQPSESDAPRPGFSMDALRLELQQALDGFDDSRAQQCLDTAFDTFSIDRVVADLLIPFLEDLGARWEREEVTVAQEHFASNLIRTRLMSLARGWDVGYGPRALLACPGGELHDLGLTLFGIALRHRGWRITFLGANTPIDTVMATAIDIDPDAVVIAATEPRFLMAEKEPLQRLANHYKLLIAGRGSDGIAAQVGAEFLDTDPLAGAERLASAVAR